MASEGGYEPNSSPKLHLHQEVITSAYRWRPLPLLLVAGILWLPAITTLLIKTTLSESQEVAQRQQQDALK